MAQLTPNRRAKIALNLKPKLSFAYVWRVLLARVWQSKESQISKPIFFENGLRK